MWVNVGDSSSPEPWEGDVGTMGPDAASLATAAGVVHKRGLGLVSVSDEYVATMKHRCLPSQAHSQTQMIACVSSKRQNP